jgi:nitric oxide reductase NorE protein
MQTSPALSEIDLQQRSSMDRTDSGTSAVLQRHLPGEEGLWVFVGGDLLIFSLFFGLFLTYRAHDVALFEQSQRALSRGLGLLNTILLLTSSLFVATAVTSARRGLHARAANLLTCGIACGVGFGVSKAFEYSAKFAAGITLKTNDFFMFYFMLTGIHMLHVIGATGVLIYLWKCTRAVEHGHHYLSVMEGGAVFWHLVDLLWVVLFALLYLLPR